MNKMLFNALVGGGVVLFAISLLASADAQIYAPGQTAIDGDSFETRSLPTQTVVNFDPLKEGVYTATAGGQTKTRTVVSDDLNDEVTISFNIASSSVNTVILSYGGEEVARQTVTRNPTTISVGDVTSTSIEILWKTRDNAFDYHVYRDGKLQGNLNFLYSDPRTGGVNTGLTPGTTYEYYVGVSYFDPPLTVNSNTLTVTTTVPDTEKPVITVNEESFSIELGETYTPFTYSATDDTDGDIAGGVIVDGDTVDIDVANTYTVTFDVADAAGNLAETVTRTVTVTDTTPPETPVLGLRAVTDTHITLFWGAVGNADSYTLTRIVGAETSEIPDITGTSYNDDSLEPETNYKYTITATNTFETSDSSNEVTITTLATTTITYTADQTAIEADSFDVYVVLSLDEVFVEFDPRHLGVYSVTLDGVTKTIAVTRDNLDDTIVITFDYVNSYVGNAVLSFDDKVVVRQTVTNESAPTVDAVRNADNSITLSWSNIVANDFIIFVVKDGISDELARFADSPQTITDRDLLDKINDSDAIGVAGLGEDTGVAQDVIDAITAAITDGQLDDTIPAQNPEAPDTTAPPVPAITTPSATVGASPITINGGSTEAGATIELFRGGTSVDTTTADGTGAFSFTGVALDEGPNSFTARASDGVNISGPSPAIVITLDSIAPVITVNPLTVTLPAGSAQPDLLEGVITDDGSPVTPSGTVNIDTPDDYTITYDSTDGTNTAVSATRTYTVTVATPPATETPAIKTGSFEVTNPIDTNDLLVEFVALKAGTFTITAGTSTDTVDVTDTDVTDEIVKSKQIPVNHEFAGDVILSFDDKTVASTTASLLAIRAGSFDYTGDAAGDVTVSFVPLRAGTFLVEAGDASDDIVVATGDIGNTVSSDPLSLGNGFSSDILILLNGDVYLRPPVVTLPGIPTLEAETPTHNSVTLSWDKIASVTGYILSRTSGGATTEIPVTETSYDDTLEPETTYTYSIRAVSIAGDSAASDVVSVTTLAAPPDTTPSPTPPDTEKPVIAPAGSDTTIELTQTNTYNEQGAAVTDNDPAYSGTVAAVSGDTPDTSGIGVYTVTYTAPADAAGNTPDQQSIVITVVDTTPPTFDVDGNTADYATTVPFGGAYTPGVINNASDISGIASSTVGGETVNVDTSGEYVVTYTVTDNNGLPATITETVTVSAAPAVDAVRNPDNSVTVSWSNIETNLPNEYVLTIGDGSNDFDTFTPTVESNQYTITTTITRIIDLNDANQVCIKGVGVDNKICEPVPEAFDITSGDGSTTSIPSDTPKKKGGDSNEWKTKPTFGKHWNNQAVQLVDDGFVFNGMPLTITNNWHTDFDLTSSIIGDNNTVHIKGYATNGLKSVSLSLGVPEIGLKTNAESHIIVNVNSNYTSPAGYDIADIVHEQKEGLVNEEMTSASIDKVKCISSDTAERCFDVTISFVIMAPLSHEVLAINAVDKQRYSTTTYINEGVEFTGEALLAAATHELKQKHGNQNPFETISLTQQDRRYQVWEDQYGYIWSQNDYGTWLQITRPDIQQRDDLPTSVMTRIHSNFANLVIDEQDRATLIFDSKAIQGTLDESFSYDMPLRLDRVSDPALLESLSIQEMLAQEMLCDCMIYEDSDLSWND